MKKKLTKAFAASVLGLGVALTGLLSAKEVGTLVSDAETLTQVTGAASCSSYQSGQCGLTSCQNSQCVEAGGLINKGKLVHQDCSSTGCATVAHAVSCGT